MATGEKLLGWMLVIVGIPLLPLPGPGTLVIVAGVALLARHYSWARKLLRPLGQRAVEAARYGVATRWRIAWSALGVVWILGLAILWWVNPEIGMRTIWGIQIGPKLPFGGRAVGLGLLVSALAAGFLLGYSVVRWREPTPARRPTRGLGRVTIHPDHSGTHPHEPGHKFANGPGANDDGNGERGIAP